MKIWTAHTRGGTRPVLLREGFSLGAFLFGPLWLLSHHAWIAGVLGLCAYAAAAVAPGNAAPVLLLGLAWLLGLCGHDILRWTLERRGFLQAHVIAARDADAAFARLLARRPDLLSEMLPGVVP